MNRKLFLCGCVFLWRCWVASPLQAQEVGFVETFALAEDRNKVLESLVPGTEDYYYFHCLHLQNTERYAEVEPLLKQWQEKHGWTPRAISIRHRQFLLMYGQNPQPTLDYLRDQLGLNLSHQRELPEAERNLPNQLPAEEVSAAAFRQRALRQSLTDGFEDRALERLARDELSVEMRRQLLARLTRPELKNLPELVAADLRSPNASPFGSLPIHPQLTLAQLQRVRELLPELANDSNFVSIYLQKLQPSEDVRLAADSAAQLAYLERLWQFAEGLAPVHNSLKAHILYRRLELDRSRGVYDRERFLKYLRLPRHVAYLRPEYLQKVADGREFCDLNADFSAATRLPPIGGDDALVADYLRHFFVEAADYRSFEEWVESNYLRRLFAETKIVHGLGDKQQWAAWLTPESYQAILERVDLDFAWSNVRQFRVDEPVELKLAIKNVDTLLVKVFEINTANYYRTHGREIDSDLPLDGLVPHSEEVFHYTDPPQLRVERSFRLDRIDHAGVYVVDFIGNGQSSRALIRKGELQHLVQTTLAGQLFTIFDEAHQKVSDAVVWVGGQRYEPNELGAVLVPFSTQPGPTPVILERGNFAALSSFQHDAEEYQLQAAMFIDRESLVRNQVAQVSLRVQLRLNGMPVPLPLLKHPRLVVQATDLDGVVSTREFADLKLAEDAETVQPFQVPTRLRRLEFRLQAEVDNVSRSEPQTLVAAQAFDVNEIDSTPAIRDVFLAGSPNGYHLEVRGKTGELRGRQAVEVAVKHQDYREPFHCTLQTNEQGLVTLGPLTGIESMTATLAGTPPRAWRMPHNRQTLSPTVQAFVGEAIELTYPDAATRSADDFSLLETRGNLFVADHSGSARWTAAGLSISDLPGGDYQLHLKPTGEIVTIRVTALARPAEAGGRIASAPLTRALVGQARLLEAYPENPLGIVGCDPQPETLEIRLAGVTPQTRVHVFADRYLTSFDPWSTWQAIRGPQLGYVRWGFRESSYVTGRDIGEEYRYILERKYAQKYPGMMLTRPSLLLNPWATRDTENQIQVANEGGDFGRSQNAMDGVAVRPTGGVAGVGGLADPSSLDFLATSAPVLLNLRPDSEGLLRIERKLLGDRQFVQVVAVDDRSTSARVVWLPLQPAEIRDLRLVRNLDPERVFAQEKKSDILRGGQPFQLEDPSSARFQAFDDLADVYRLYQSLNQDPWLTEFRFVLEWGSKSAEEKRALYSKYACHELNFFLMKKDPEFFAAVVAPFLGEKHTPQFMDLWLRGQLPESAADLWEYQRLNAAEKILWGQTSAARREQIRAWIESAYNFQPTPRQVFNLYFDTALKSAALDESGAAAEFDRAKGALSKDKEDSRYYLGKQLANAPAPSEAPAAAAAPEGGGSGGLGGGKPGGDQPVIAGLEAGAAGEAAGDSSVLMRGARDAKEKTARRELAETEQKLSEELARKRVSLGVNAFYRRLPPTQEWVENDYYHLPREQQNPQRIPVNRFWRDYAAHPAGTPFLSPYFPEAASTFSEIMFALAVLDLPLAAQEAKVEVVDQQLRITPTHDALAFYQQIAPATRDERSSQVLISENFFRVDDRYRQEGAQRYDKFVTDEFLMQVLYGAQVVVTNPTSTPQAVDILVQIPQGALPASATQPTRTWQVDLQPFSTQTFEYQFYFPLAGDFAHYPAQVTLEQRVIASALRLPFHVVEQATQIDRTSWAYLSQHGSNDDVVTFLQQQNLNGIDLTRVAFRLRDRDMFERVTATLAGRLVFDPVLWAYGVFHNNRQRVSELLQHSDDFLRAAGPALVSPLITIDPIARRWYQHREYWPLANARAHQLGRTRQIMNPVLLDQYQQWLAILACRREFAASDRVELTYYLLLQDRFAEALAQFERIERAAVPQQLPFDYLSSYMALLREELPAAEQVAERRADYPVERWAKLFRTLLAHVAEAQGGQPDPADPANREERQAELAARQPGFEFTVAARQIQLEYQNLGEVTINYYTMDIELLFSRTPFVSQRTDGFAIIRPNFSQTVQLAANERKVTLELPDAYRTANVLVEVVGAGQRKSKPYFANSLTVQLNENYGQLRVLHQADQRPLSKVYVKVYAKNAAGSVVFYKDGYTDLRGRFDYVSLSNQTLDEIERFSLLIASEQDGAVILEAGVPKE